MIRCALCGATRKQVRIWLLFNTYPNRPVVCCAAVL